MEKVNEKSIMDRYFLKTYTADGMSFNDLINNIKAGFNPISIKVDEDTDKDMKSFGSVEIPFEEYLNGKDAPTSVGDTIYTLIGSLNGAVVEISLVTKEDLVTIMSKHPEIEITQIIEQKKNSLNM